MVRNLQSSVENWQPMVQNLQSSVENWQLMVQNLQSIVKVAKNWQALWKSNWLSFNNFKINQRISEVSAGVSDGSETCLELRWTAFSWYSVCL